MATTVPVDRARDRIRGLARSADDGAAYRDEVLHVLRAVVPWDGAVLAPFDPATLLPTAGTGIGVELRDCQASMELEYRRPDVGAWVDLAREAAGVAVLSDRTRGDPMQSPRYRDLYRPQGWRDELRASLRLGGTCWGGVILLRAGRRGFTPADVAAIAAVQSALAEGLRTLALRGSPGALEGQGPDGPAVFTVDARGHIEGSTRAALELLARAHGERSSESGLLAPIQAVAARQRVSADGTARVRLRARDGGWLVLQAGSLRVTDGAERTVVTVEPARPPEVVSVVAAGIGLTSRETEVLEQLLAGLSSVEIGRRLFLSPHTVNDHVRHIFEKAGVNSRMELLAWLFFSQYAPRLAGPPALRDPDHA